MKSSSINIIHWLPRILCILTILFISIFAFDAFDPALTIWQQLAGLFIHLIPSFLLIILLLIAWKWEKTGGIIFMIIGIVMSPILFQHNYNMNHSLWVSLEIILMITFPILIVGILFIVSDLLKKKQMKAA